MFKLESDRTLGIFLNQTFGDSGESAPATTDKQRVLV